VAILSHPSTTPPRGSLLYAVEVPYNEHGEALGETLFVSSAAAYEALPAARQQQLLGLRAMHRAGAKQYVPGSQLADAVKDLPDVIHPVIRTHPLTGRRASMCAPANASALSACLMRRHSRLSRSCPTS
jgi:alpha-ketoglutarate-dependent taurine dioxygenase